MESFDIKSEHKKAIERNLNCEFGIPPKEESTELSILKLVNGISQQDFGIPPKETFQKEVCCKWNPSEGLWHPSERDVFCLKF